jgi:Na+/H+ antiporter NhaD/arsenite permease-like protein
VEQQALWAIGLFLIVYGLIISEKIHRTIIAMIGGLLMVAVGIVDQETALHHIDFNTLGLLIGMMVMVNITADTGFFTFIAVHAARKSKGSPIRLLLALTVITAVCSAFLDNVTTVLLLTPVTFQITRQLRVSAFPFLFAQIIASNVGGTATLIGDPPNIMIGSAVQELTFTAFLVNLAPIVILILAVYLPIFVLLFRKQLRTTPELAQKIMNMADEGLITDRILLGKCLFALTLTMLGFFIHHAIHMESASIALAGAFLLLLLSGERKMESALAKVEWMTIFFFVGLFVLISGLVETGVISRLATQAVELTNGNLLAATLLILWFSAVASAFVDNIPFVAAMIPLIQEMGVQGIDNLQPLWWSLALGACLGGNGTLVGASANLVVAGLAGKQGEPITFLRFTKYGFPLMLLSIVLSSVYVLFRYVW